ncbi:DNA mismatch repair protein [Chitinophaga silvatica]|uniref:DNA mismatch repair protein n=1 Tax=Chitinophaga silvatica TaxID=2282649 RepID=A0A3E1Y8Q1_9BACT|nr:DNA mismatch repair protein [Chitinophaga silvatica]RFS21783.1 DNA mismatch repair protein [Chitinophaga silvatica]
MNLIADKQTLDDLSVLGKYNPASVFNLFNKVKTRGAEKLLDSMFQHPLTDPDKINSRSATFRYFSASKISFPFEDSVLQRMESYLDEGNDDSYFLALLKTGRKKVAEVLVKDDAYQLELTGIESSIQMLKTSKELAARLQLEGRDKNSPWSKWVTILLNILKDSGLNLATENRSFLQTVKLHHLLTGVFRDQLKQLLELTYEIDLFITVAEVSNERNFTYAKALPKEKNILIAKDVRHPGLSNAVANPLSFNRKSNILFLTGANMAGKSTLMKATGIMIYLAHMGFPVAASELEFSVLDGIYSSVNVPDDLNMGYSHFYAEVLRVKKVAEEVAAGKSIFVIFDELFKGTNVKDAYDATLAVTDAFTAFTDCFFIISTHIFEAGHALMEKGSQIQFEFLPTVMKANVPQYTYRLEKGITADRQGMIIIENEGILEML